MGTLAETAFVDYRLFFGNQGKHTSVFRCPVAAKIWKFRFPFISIYIYGKQNYIHRYRYRSRYMYIYSFFFHIYIYINRLRNITWASIFRFSFETTSYIICNHLSIATSMPISAAYMYIYIYMLPFHTENGIRSPEDFP
jgi:hypothetical protein